MGSRKPAIKKESALTQDAGIEILDITGTAQNTMSDFREFFKDISKAPVAKQAAVGGCSGWVVGYLSMKVGKMAATAVGGGLIIMQLAAHQGYIKVDWRRVNKDLESKAKKLTKEVESRINPGIKDQTLDRAAQNVARKIDKTLNSLERKTDSFFESKMKSGEKLYRKYILGDKDKLTVEDLYVINMYIIAFSAGTMLGVATAKLI